VNVALVLLEKSFMIYSLDNFIYGRKVIDGSTH
jgi:hypothetical protein